MHRAHKKNLTLVIIAIIVIAIIVYLFIPKTTQDIPSVNSGVQTENPTTDIGGFDPTDVE